MNLSGAHVLLTGATGGIGGALALEIARQGGSLTLTGRRADELEALARSVAGRHVVADLSDPADVVRLIEESGSVDVLVANAALPASGALLDYDAAAIDRALDVNLRAPIQLARALAPGMVERGRGHLVFVSSLAGLVASPSSSLYSAGKFGLRGFALGLRQDLRHSGVGVSVVLPGFVRDAGMFADSGAQLPAGVGTRSPGDVAAAVVRAIVRDRAEIVVAPPLLAAGAYLGGLLPAVVARGQHLLGGDRIAGRVADGQRGRR